jgi:hypothetical protein
MAEADDAWNWLAVLTVAAGAGVVLPSLVALGVALLAAAGKLLGL